MFVVLELDIFHQVHAELTGPATSEKCTPIVTRAVIKDEAGSKIFHQLTRGISLIGAAAGDLSFKPSLCCESRLQGVCIV